MVSCYLPDGRRIRHRFHNERKAREKHRELAGLLAAEGTEGFRFDAARRAEYVAAVNSLGEVGATLREAVDFYRAHHTGGPAVPFAEAVEGLLSVKLAANRSKRTIAGLRGHLRAFGYHGAIETVSEVTHEKIRAFIYERKLTPWMVLSLRTSLAAFCRFARHRGWLHVDPLAGLDRPVIDAVPARAHSPEEIARLMTATVAVGGGGCVRRVALLAFAGLRPSEVDALDDSDILPSVIRVAFGKKRGRRAVRTVPISPVLRAWLDLHPAAPLKGLNWKRNWVKIRKLARVKVGQDGLRKTWISYRLAETKDERVVAREGGNSPTIIYRHYFDLVDPVNVPRYGAFSAWPRPAI